MNGEAKIKPEILEELPTIGETITISGHCGLQGKDGELKGTQDTAQHKKDKTSQARSVKRWRGLSALVRVSREMVSGCSQGP